MMKFNKRHCVGLAIAWLDPEPWGDSNPQDMKIVSSGEVISEFVQDYYKQHYFKIMTTPLSWLVTLKVLFDVNGKIEIKEYEIELFTSIIGRGSDKFLEALSNSLTEAFEENEQEEESKKGEYMWCEFDAQIVGY